MRLIIILAFFMNLMNELNGCVYLTVSSYPPNKIEVHWNCDKIVESVLVYDDDPQENPGLKPLARIRVGESLKGYLKTNVSFRPEPFPGGWSKGAAGSRDTISHCLYWAGVQVQGQLLHGDCFGIQPSWMFRNKDTLKNLSLPLMFIPGTHNSGTNAMKTIKKRGFSHLDDLVLTQDQTVWNQLVYGIRFLDLRVGHYPQEIDPDLRFWINHDLLRIQPLKPVLKDIAEFSRASPGEIIILDFHRFPAGFRTKNSADIHRELIEVIGKELKDLAILRPPSQEKLKLEQIWNTDKRIVVSYSEDNFVWETPWLWSSVSQRWGNKQSPETLKKFLDNTFKEVTTKKLWAAMAELTPTPLDFLSNGSLRLMADSVNHLLDEWFKGKQNWTTKANIVAPDFFLGTDLVKIAIGENLRRGQSLRQSL